MNALGLEKNHVQGDRGFASTAQQVDISTRGGKYTEMIVTLTL